MSMPLWSWLLPVVAVVLLVAGLLVPVGTVLAILCAAALIGAVIAAVHHAEVVAHRLGEPFGTLVLTASITIIEVALIVTLMLGGGADKAALPRDTIFSAIMRRPTPHPRRIGSHGRASGCCSSRWCRWSACRR